MILLIVVIAITCIAGYLVVRLDEEHPFMNTLLFVSIVSALIIPSLLLFKAFDYFNIEGLNIIPATLPLLLMGLLVIWATWGESSSGNGSDDKKDDFVTDAMILTTVLSESESDKDSSNSNSNSSNSSSNSDDFFIL